MSARSPSSTMVHEIGHHIEYQHPEVLAAAIAFRARRTAGDPLRRMSDLRPGHGYGRKEVTYPDDFIDPYVGKVYRTTRGSTTTEHATEVVTMGLEAMYKDPLEFWRKDPDHFRFTWELMNGEVPTP